MLYSTGTTTRVKHVATSRPPITAAERGVLLATFAQAKRHRSIPMIIAERRHADGPQPHRTGLQSRSRQSAFPPQVVREGDQQDALAVATPRDRMV